MNILIKLINQLSSETQIMSFKIFGAQHVFNFMLFCFIFVSLEREGNSYQKRRKHGTT